MSDRVGRERALIWLVCRVDGYGLHLFSGTLEEMVAHINCLHVSTGTQHVARKVES